MATITTTAPTTTTPPTNNTTTTTDQTNAPPLHLPTLLTTPITYAGHFLTTHLLPESRRTAILTTLRAHPLLSSFLLAQVLCSGVPILLFILGLVISASLAASVFACFAVVVLVPVLVFTGLLGVWGWGVAWGCFVLGRWGFGVVLSWNGDRDGDGDGKDGQTVGVNGVKAGGEAGGEVVEVKEEDLVDEKKGGLGFVVREKEVEDAA